MAAEDTAVLLVKTLLKYHKTVSTAESCTGGMIASEIVNISGASDVFGYGFVTYANEAKVSELRVGRETIKEYGAVSEECAREMAEGCRKHAKSDYAAAVTGIAGPTGGTPEKPVGLVYIAVSSEKETYVLKNNFSGDRLTVRKQTAEKALELLLRLVRKENEND